MLPTPQFRDVTIKDYAIVLKRRVWLILACFIISTTWSAIKTFQKTPLYKTSCKVLMGTSRPDIVPVKETNLDRSWVGYMEYVNSQIKILYSRTLASKVVEYLSSIGDKTFADAQDPESAFLSGVSVDFVPGTQVLNIGYISSDPVKAARFANALTTTYIKADLSKTSQVSSYASDWLTQQLDEIKKKLEVSEKQLNDFIQENQIISLPDIERKSQVILDGLKSERLRVENEMAALATRYRPKHPSMLSLKTKLDSIDKSIQDETNKLLALNQKMITYNSLKREVDTNISLYDALLRRTKETEVTKQLETTNISIIDSADVPKYAFSPNRKREISLGAFLGFFAGIILAFFLEYLDSTVKTAEDIETYVRLPFLGYIPSAKHEIKLGKDIDIASNKLPHSRISEAYRSIRTSIIFSTPEDRPLKTLLITSASPQEGKTTVAINLAIVFAKSNEKVLLIEADMRRPRISESLGVKAQSGLSNLLTGNKGVDDVVNQTSVPNLYFISSGPKPPNPAELLTSVKTRNLLNELRERFDRIIIDSPPVISVADTAILANIVDGVIDVIRAGFLNIELILRGRQRLYEAKARIIGVILNNVNVKSEDSYYYYHYYYADDKAKK
ncbi:MAG: polysaccharide biosynthesis tyrosine autokinase [Candidatus Omnitrophota bacterium]|jgi:capsular exopolysaccharide synthesis family protein|nr:MAG: polysaccharide biosynthesis tyrosine autokinase [Candidatus Omnitrophota bacterium]